MCGICGFVSRRLITIEQLKRMNDTVYYRGPDDSGEEIYDLKNNYTLGLAHRRLAILDLSPLGHQPMHSGNGRISIVFNGEIYNFRELKKELGEVGFKSNSDTEVIIAAYLKWGIECISRFNGMFAIAIFDRLEETLYLARDRIGKKPLYYWLDGENIIFASECKPIMILPHFKREINTEVIGQYLYHQYIQAPQTIFRNVYKLEPATILSFKYGNVSKTKYWDVVGEYEKNMTKKPKSYEEMKAELKELLIDATRKRMIADVPYGSFLSGGYDSSLITAIAQSISDKPVKTFCIGFNEHQYNEARYAKQIADYLGTDHTELYLDEKEMLNLVDSIPQYFDEPFADSSEIPTMLVSKLAREKVTVVLSGDGGDELFCGYNLYELINLAQKLDPIGNIVYSLFKTNKSLWKLLPQKMKVIASNRDYKAKTQFYIEKYTNIIDELVLSECSNSIKYDESNYCTNNWQTRRMLLDQETYLPGDILCKVDRASMKYSLETRCPILDHRVIEYSYQLPHEFKYQKGTKKRILKDIAYEYIPREFLERPKQGFTVPMKSWLRGPLKEQLLDVSNTSFLKKQGLFSPLMCAYVDDFLHNKDDKHLQTFRIVWAFLVFQQWYQKYID